MATIVDLNTLEIENDGNFPELKSKDNSLSTCGADITVLFRNQKRELIKLIERHNCIVGAVAWLTDKDILAALAKVDHVSIIVQKEDFLRPDIGTGKSWPEELRAAYRKLRNTTDRFSWPGLLGSLSVSSDPAMTAVRCVGNHNSAKLPAFPRMHNKFLVFGDIKNDDIDSGAFDLALSKVWTGSYNLTFNAANSLENAVVIESPDVARAFYDEYCQIFALSEDLDWTSNWCAPEFRIGT